MITDTSPVYSLCLLVSSVYIFARRRDESLTAQLAAAVSLIEANANSSNSNGKGIAGARILKGPLTAHIQLLKLSAEVHCITYMYLECS